MSLVRTGNAPGQWRDEGPQPHVSRHYRVGGALVTSQRGPAVSVTSTAEAQRVARRMEANRLAREAARLSRPTCGAILGIIGEPCARKPGHKDCHRSAALMRDEAIRRRGRHGRDRSGGLLPGAWKYR